MYTINSIVYINNTNLEIEYIFRSKWKFSTFQGQFKDF